MFKIMFKANKCFEDYFYNEARMACAEAKEYGWTEQEFGYLIEDMGDYLEITIFEKDMFCASCGKKITSASRFCEFCGKENIYYK